MGDDGAGDTVFHTMEDGDTEDTAFVVVVGIEDGNGDGLVE